MYSVVFWGIHLKYSQLTVDPLCSRGITQLNLKKLQMKINQGFVSEEWCLLKILQNLIVINFDIHKAGKKRVILYWFLNFKLYT